MSIRWTFAACLLLPLLPEGVFAQDAARPFGREQRVRWTTSRIRGTPEPPPPYRTESAFPRLTFKEPLEADAAPVGNRLFVAERYGRILSFVNDAQSDQADVFLDLGKVIYGFAFHPKFEQNGHVFVTYVVDAAKEEPRGTRLARFTVANPGDNPPRCDPATETII